MCSFYIIFSLLIFTVENTDSSTLCFRQLGCLKTNNSWFSPNRPFNPAPNSREDVNTTFHLYNMKTKRDGEEIFTDYETLETESYIKNASWNFLIIHGFRSWGKADWIMDMKDELLRIFGDKINVISVDWSGHGVDYAQTAVDARIVGLEVAQFIQRGLRAPPARLHLLGHSLGAHVCGYVGERVPGVARITGLDPAGAHFSGMPSYVRLDPSDAVFVDVIHTDTQGYGTSRPMGHTDFFANSDAEQPGCGALSMFPQFVYQGINATLQETGTCAHSRSHQYLIESLQAYKSTPPTCKFVAYQCKSFQDVNEGKCIHSCNPYTDDNCMYVGLEARPLKNKKNVIFYFKTGNYKPYCVSAYRTYMDIEVTSLPVMYTVVYLTLYDSKGASTGWVFNDGYPLALQSGMLLSALVFSPAVLTSREVTMANFHWNSRFYPFGLLRRALVNGFLRLRSISVTTLDGKRVKLCPRGNNGLSVDIYEYEEVMFYFNECKEVEEDKGGNREPDLDIRLGQNPASTTILGSNESQSISTSSSSSSSLSARSPDRSSQTAATELCESPCSSPHPLSDLGSNQKQGQSTTTVPGNYRGKGQQTTKIRRSEQEKV